MKIANSMMDLIGNIPLVRLSRIGADTGVEILVKPEYLNPSGSIKDRIAKYMIEAAEQDGALKPGDTIVEASTGNTGTALAFVSAVKGYKMKVLAPAKVANPQRAAIMLAYGSEITKIDTDSYEEGRADIDSSVHGGAIEVLPRIVCREMENEQEGVWWARQFANEYNVKAHEEWTAGEILEGTDGKLDAFVASVGTGGTLLGCGRRLKEHDPNIAIIGVEPANSPMLASDRSSYPLIPGITDGIMIDIFDSDLVSRIFCITDEEAIDMAHQLSEKEGIFCGISSGANVLACLRLAKEIGPGKRIVTVLPDSRDRYLAVEKYTT